MFGRLKSRNPEKAIESYLREIMFSKSDNQELAIPVATEPSGAFSRCQNYNNSAFVEINKTRKGTSVTTTSSKQQEILDNANDITSPKQLSSIKKKIKKPIKKRFLDIGERDTLRKRQRRPPNHLETTNTPILPSNTQGTTTTNV